VGQALPRTIANQMIEWCLQADIDGFDLSRTVVPECFDDFIELVVPQLQERGALQNPVHPGTFRNKLFGREQTSCPTHRSELSPLKK